MNQCEKCYNNLGTKSGKIYCNYAQEYIKVPVINCAAQILIGHADPPDWIKEQPVKRKRKLRFLTEGQKSWLFRKTIKENDFYMFPSFGFNVYPAPSHADGFFMDTNPLTKSLDHEYFFVKEKIDGFCRGNFYHNPKGHDMYLLESELSRRSAFEVLILFLVSFLPFVIYNCVKKLTKKNND